MKIIAVTGNHEPGAGKGTIAMHLLADSALLRTNRPFFLPTNVAPHWQAHPAVAVQIGRLGKGVAQRFASRYISGVMACLVAVPHGAGGELDRWDARLCSCDGTLMLGDAVPGVAPAQARVTALTAPGTEAGTLEAATMAEGFDELVAEASRAMTLKTGDLVVDVAPVGFTIAEGTNLWATLCGKPSLEIRVK